MGTSPLFSLPPPAPDPAVVAEAGQVVDAAEGRWGLATAVFSGCRTWRYRLSRVWGGPRRRVNFVMLNPSTADAWQLDPTVRRCVGFARAWGAGAVCVTNLFAVRSPRPSVLREVNDPVGPDNDAAILAAAGAADLVVAAWGTHGEYRGRDAQVRALLDDAGVELHVLRLTAGGHPGHPLYVPAAATPQPWRPRGR